MSSAAWKTVLRVAEQPVPHISGTALWRACRGAEALLLKNHLLIRTPEISSGPLSHDSDDDAFENGYEHRPNPAASRVLVQQRTSDPHLYRLNIDWLLRALARSLGIKRAFLTAEILPDLLWRLGGLTAGSRDAIFFVARRLFHGDRLARVRDELFPMLGQQPFVILITARSRPDAQLPSGLRIISLHECAWLDTEGVNLDRERVGEVVRSAFAAPGEDTGFRHTPTYDVVRLRGLAFHLSPNRRQAVRKLHDASKTENPWVSGRQLVEGKMVEAFKRLKPNWRLLIESDRKGKYRLNL